VTTKPPKPRRWCRILIGVGIFCFAIFVGIPTAQVLCTRFRISSALRSASTVRLEEYSFPRILTSRVITPAEYRQITDAVPITLQVGVPGVILRCFQPHHRVVITDTSQRETTFYVCFTCEEFCLSGGDVHLTPSAWRQPLRQLFLRNNIPIRERYPPDMSRTPESVEPTGALPESAVNVEAKDQPDDRRDVVLRMRTPQPTNAVMQHSTNVLTFEILNNGRSRLVCPDLWSLLFDDGTVQYLSLPKTGNIYLQPGKKAALAVTKPATARAWRLVASFYFEDYVFEAKVKIDQSPLKNHLPRSFSGVQGKVVMSDWIK
jgi:hypothetical protein